MVKDLYRITVRPIHFTFVLEVPDVFLSLRVNRNNGYACGIRLFAGNKSTKK
jgi:hypothetical protein